MALGDLIRTAASSVGALVFITAVGLLRAQYPRAKAFAGEPGQ